MRVRTGRLPPRARTAAAGARFPDPSGTRLLAALGCDPAEWTPLGASPTLGSSKWHRGRDDAPDATTQSEEVSAMLKWVLPALVLTLAACSPAPPQPTTPTSPPSSGNTEPRADESVAASSSPPTVMPDDSTPELTAVEAFGRRFEKAIREGDVETLTASFDTDAVLEGICAGVPVSPAKLADLRAAFRPVLRENVHTFIGAWKDEDPRFKGAVRRGSALDARFRFASSENGIGIVDFALRSGPSGLRIHDFRNRTVGNAWVDDAREALLPMLVEVDPSLLERGFGMPGVSRADLKAFRLMVSALNEGKWETTLEIHAKLPKPLQDTVAATSAYVLAMQRSDDPGYAAALERAAAQFPAPRFRFMMVDVYSERAEWDKAIACVDELITSTERDAALLALRAGLQMRAGALSAARITLRDALAADPDCEFVHSEGIDILLAASDWAGVRDSIRFLESTEKYDFTSLMSNPEWKGFLESPESEPWR